MIKVQVGDRLTFAEERNGYTVQAVSPDGRWAACTKPFLPENTVLYTVVDFENQVRGRDNYSGLSYETQENCQRIIEMFYSGDATHSLRHPPIALHITQWRQAAQGSRTTPRTVSH